MIRLAYLLAVIALCALLVVAAEVAARLSGLGHPLLYEESPLYGYAPKSDQQQVRRRGALVTIGSFGLRGSRDWTEAADQRILFIGDSVTYGGSYIDDRETFADRTCQALAVNGLANVLCGNGGVNAYGTDNMRARLAHLPFADYDAVVVTILPGDATRGMARLRSLPYFSKPLTPPLRALTEALAFGLDQVRTRLRFVRRSSGRLEPDLARAARLSMDQLLMELRALAAQGKLVTIVYTPARRELESETTELDTLVWQAIAGSGLPYLDMREALREETLDDIYYDNVHLDVQGHALYSAAIAELLLPLLSPSDR